jgi:predicted PurR-regulated permease PerM
VSEDFSSVELLEKLKRVAPEVYEEALRREHAEKARRSDAQRKRRLEWITNSIAAVAMGVAFFATFVSGIVDVFPFFIQESESPSPELAQSISVLEQNFQSLSERIGRVEEILSQPVDAGTELAVVADRAKENTERIAALEGLLDLQPREVIEITRLSDEIGDVSRELELGQQQVLRELERAYNTVLALIGSLLVAVVAMVIGNFIRTGSTK